MWRGGSTGQAAARRAAVAAARRLTATTTTTSSSSASSCPLLLRRRLHHRRLASSAASSPSSVAPAAGNTRAAAIISAPFSTSSSRSSSSSHSSSNHRTTAVATTLALLAAASGVWRDEESAAARQDAGTFHARPPARPRRVLYSIATYPGNEFIEDRHEIRELQGGDVFCGVFDGHGGWQVAEYASAHLSRNLEVELSNMGSLSGTDQVSKALVRAFERTDRGVIQKVHHAFEIGLGNVAKVGSCAISVLVRGQELYVANAGDCRAVLGKRVVQQPQPQQRASTKAPVAAASEGPCTYEAVPLSEEHNAKLPKEMALLQQAHPGEADIVRCKNPNACYVKGRLQPTRSLGDAYLKYPEFNGRPNRSDSSAGRYIPPPYTPPYVTATPEVRVFPVLGDANAEFVIIATDGVWDLLTNEEAVAFVGAAIAEGDVAHVSQRLIAHALETRAKDLGMTVEELRALPAGRVRRSKHDDMTCLVLLLQGAADAGGNPQEGINVSIDPTMPPAR